MQLLVLRTMPPTLAKYLVVGPVQTGTFLLEMWLV